jgi:predicted transcriptional regulator
MDYFTKWPEAKAVKSADAKEVSKFIYEEIICRHGCPKRILSDRGSHFNNDMVKGLVEKFDIKHGFSTPYHPKTNGLVERFNKTLCESLAKLGGNKNWDKNIAPVLFAYRSKIQESAKITPFYLVYERKAILLMDREVKGISVIKRIEQLIERLPQIRWQAREEIKETKHKIKLEFEIGDKVLYYNAAKEKQWSGKLEEKWKGPYYIHSVIVNGSYKLKELDGKILKTPVNGELLKKYYDRKEFESFVVI